MMIMITIMREGFKSGRYGKTSLLSDSLFRFKFIYALKYQTVLKIQKAFFHYVNMPSDKHTLLKIWEILCACYQLPCFTF